MTAQEIMKADLEVVANIIYLGRKQQKNLYEITRNSCFDCNFRNTIFTILLSSRASDCVDVWNDIMTILKDFSDIDI